MLSYLQEYIANKMPISYIARTINSSVARGFQAREKQQTTRLSTLTSPYLAVMSACHQSSSCHVMLEPDCHSLATILKSIPCF
jgi:hypothetical protein